ncbi:CTLH/CRA C-terminal to lish motif domain-containing protein [Dipodascopsis tothii]|uniref:CTLH/CRA C-terminal to lish motif domain-containing protein n=1 Tax=Dipodascopsis tothii TaxID=44089 RepID=UPI0034CDB23F
MDGIKKEFGRLSKGGFDRYIQDVDEMIELLQKTRDTIDAAPQARREQLMKLKMGTNAWTNKIGQSQKDVHAGISKYGKALDRKFKVDVEMVYNGDVFPESSQALLDKAVAMHLIREGEFEVADRLISEAGLDIARSLEDEFVDMYRILMAMRDRNLQPAVAWAASKRPELSQAGSNLEFDLHRLQFVHYFTAGDGAGTQRALEYARANFGGFGDRYLAEISKLMCGFLYKDNLAASPYTAQFLSPNAWSDVAVAFTKEFCSLLGLSPESPLYVAAVAGAIALPTLLKMGNIMKEKNTEWSSANELPVEIPLPAKFQYHSIFVCPVSKEQTTDENPPMMMPCGHIVAKESLARLSKSNANQRFKCPYCPSESIPTQAIRVYF